MHTQQTRPRTVDWGGRRGPGAAGEERPWLTESSNQTGGSSAFAPHATRQLEGLGDGGILVPRVCTSIVAGNHGGLADGVAVRALPSRGSSDRRVVVAMMLVGIMATVVVVVVVAATGDWRRRQAIEGASKAQECRWQSYAAAGLSIQEPTRRGPWHCSDSTPVSVAANTTRLDSPRHDTTPVLVLFVGFTGAALISGVDLPAAQEHAVVPAL